MRAISAELAKTLKENEKLVIFSKFPIDDVDCPCQKQVRDHIKNIDKLNDNQKLKYYEKIAPYQCPKSKNKKLYNLVCQNCDEIVAQVNAVDDKLKDLCNFHYISWANRKGWRGTFGININPYKKDIRIECCCGENKSFRSYQIEEVL